MNNQSTAGGEIGRQYNDEMKMSVTFSKIMPWHWSDQPIRNCEKLRAQHKQRFKPRTCAIPTNICSH
jgi:hypothetical protein